MGWGKNFGTPDDQFGAGYGDMGAGAAGYGSTGGMGGMGSNPDSMEYDAGDGGSGTPWGALIGGAASNTNSAKAAAAGGPPSMSGDIGSGASKGGAIGAGVGLLKFSGDQEQYKQQGLLAANRDRLSYITGRQGEMPKPISPWNNALAFGSQGAAYGQSMDNAKAQTQLQQAYLNNMNASTAAINRGQFTPVASYGTMGKQAPNSRISDSIWNDPGLTDPSSVGPDGYARSTRWGS